MAATGGSPAWANLSALTSRLYVPVVSEGCESASLGLVGLLVALEFRRRGASNMANGKKSEISEWFSPKILYNNTTERSYTTQDTMMRKGCNWHSRLWVLKACSSIAHTLTRKGAHIYSR